MADVAAIFHWPPAVMDVMTVAELMDWCDMAVARFKSMNGVKDG